MKRPLLWTVLFFILGILAEHYIPKGMYLVLLFSVVLLISIFLIRYYKSYAPAVFYSFLILGFFLSFTGQQPLNQSLEALAENEETTTIYGTVIDIGNTKTGKQKLTIKTKEIKWYSDVYYEPVKLYALIERNNNLEIGKNIMLKGELLTFNQKTIPNGFDEIRYMKTKGYDYKMFPEEIKIKEEKQSSFFIVVNQLRKKICEIYDAVLPQKEAGILKAMITGNKDDIDELTRDLYNKAGIAHIIAISGLHVTVISVFLFYILERFLKNKRLCSFITILFLFCYMIFTGCSASTVRAVIMTSTMLFGTILFREGEKYNTVALAALLLLLYQPLYLWDIGFQLSFTAVIGIFMGNTMIKKYRKIKNKALDIMIISAIVCFSSFPIIAYHFYYVPLGGILANVIVVPLIGIVVGFGMFVGLAGLFSIHFATFLVGIVFILLKIYEFVCIIISKLSFLYIHIGRPPLLFIVLFYITFICIYFYYYSKIFKYITIVSTSCLFLSLVSNRLFFKNTEVAYLDVGQGDSTIIHTYDNKTIVIDGGGKYYADFGDNTGANVVYPYLEYLGTTTIDILFITHMDSDHTMGAIELMDLANVKQVIISDYHFESNSLYDLFLETVRKNQIPLYIIQSEDKITINENTKIECLYPIEGEKFYLGDNNNGSLVLKLICGEIDFLFTGDAGAADESVMIQEGKNVAAQILKAGHHGSKYSSTPEFLQKVSPNAAIISSGKNNIYKHPHKETLERLRAENCEILNTAEVGTILIKTNGQNYEINTMIER